MRAAVVVLTLPVHISLEEPSAYGQGPAVDPTSCSDPQPQFILCKPGMVWETPNGPEITTNITLRPI